jgi:tripartite-type tricarboxylate transporter receptor subunit TctC
VTRLNAALMSTLSSREVRDKFQTQAFEPYITTPEEAGKFIAAEAQRFSKLIKARKITAE